MAHFVNDENILEKAKLNPEYLRSERAVLFKAFDILKTNYSVGLINITSSRWNEIKEWYSKALDLNPSAIDEYPTELERYL